MRSRFTEEQIIRVLEEGRAGMNVEELCRKHGISHPTYYNWKTKYSDMTVSEAKYNERRPHSSLGGRTPAEAARGEEKLTGTSI